MTVICWKKTTSTHTGNTRNAKNMGYCLYKTKNIAIHNIYSLRYNPFLILTFWLYNIASTPVQMGYRGSSNRLGKSLNCLSTSCKHGWFTKSWNVNFTVKIPEAKYTEVQMAEIKLHSNCRWSFDYWNEINWRPSWMAALTHGYTPLRSYFPWPPSGQP